VLANYVTNHNVYYYDNSNNEYVLIGSNDVNETNLDTTWAKAPFYTYRSVSNSNGNEDHYITLSSSVEATYPLSIGTSISPGGRKFRVTWDGKAYLTDAYLDNAYISGHIEAQDGTLGDLEVVGTLTGGRIEGSYI